MSESDPSQPPRLRRTRRRTSPTRPPTVRIPKPPPSAENAQPAPAAAPPLTPPPSRSEPVRRSDRRPLSTGDPDSRPEGRRSLSVGLLYVLIVMLTLSMGGLLYFMYQLGGKVAKAEEGRIEQITALKAKITTLEEANASLREEVAEGVRRAENAAQVVADHMTTTQDMFDRVMERIPEGVGSFILQPDTPPPPPESSPFFSERTLQEDADLLKKKITEGFGRLIKISPPDEP